VIQTTGVPVPGVPVAGPPAAAPAPPVPPGSEAAPAKKKRKERETTAEVAIGGLASDRLMVACSVLSNSALMADLDALDNLTVIVDHVLAKLRG
jgi:hypothetical protein